MKKSELNLISNGIKSCLVESTIRFFFFFFVFVSTKWHLLNVNFCFFHMVVCHQAMKSSQPFQFNSKMNFKIIVFSASWKIGIYHHRCVLYFNRHKYIPSVCALFQLSCQFQMHFDAKFLPSHEPQMKFINLVLFVVGCQTKQ